MGLCPFHNEKTPSFSVNDENGFYHCFGCGAGGNVFKFLMETEGLAFPEAVRKVGDRYGISVPEQGGGPGISSDERAALFEANAQAARYFHRFLLESEHGKPALEYLRGRGVSDTAIETFQLGAAPTSGTGLVRWLARENVDLRVGERLGLLFDRGGRAVDRFRNRVMFPIRDAQGRVIGFGGRMLGDGDGPKYLNSPESDVYRKSRALYGLFESREALRTTECAILVEGYLDVIALHEGGIANVVATCGTALTVDQARAMRRVTPEAVTLFDGDEAGTRAAARSFPVFIEAGMWPKGVVLPGGEDPDSYVRSQGPDALRRAVGEATPLADAYVRHVVDAAPGGDAGMARAGSELAGLLRKVSDPFEYDLLVRKAALWTGISEAVLRSQSAAGGQPARTAEAPARRKGGAPGPEELLVTIMMRDPNTVVRVDESAVINSMEDGVWQALARDIIERAAAGAGDADAGELLQRLPDDYRNRVAGRLVEDPFNDPAKRERALADCIKSIEQTARRRHNASVLHDLRKREESGAEVTPEEELARWRPRDSSDV